MRVPGVTSALGGLFLSQLMSQALASLIVDSFTTHNARQGDSFKASVSGLLSGDSDFKFKKLDSEGGDWVQVSSNGELSGTPGPSAGPTKVTLEVVTSGNSSSRLNVTIPVRPAGEPLVDQLDVLTYNLWHGGSQVNDYHRKQVRFLSKSNVDVVGFQESTGGHATRLGKALGWYSWQSRDVGLISRYPIVETSFDKGWAGSVRIALDGEESQVNIWNVHLGYNPYGPYDFCFDKMPVDRVIQREAESKRTPQIVETIQAMEKELAASNEVPVILLGDFNAPSHLDWVEATRDKHCGYANVKWPTSTHPIDAGMTDTFRTVHPQPGHRSGHYVVSRFLNNNGRKEPLDRIDFIYLKGKMSILESETVLVGSPTSQPNHKNNEWTSDHAAVRTLFKVSN